MTPSKEAIEAAKATAITWWSGESEHPPVDANKSTTIERFLEAAYAIDVAPLEKRFAIISELAASRGMENDALKERAKELEADVAKYKSFGTENEELELRLKDLEAENQRLGEQLAHFKDCYAELAEAHDKAQLERKGGDVE